jgi:hypothetical protein
MIVIIANRRNHVAQALAQQWAAWDAAVLSAQDLSVAGWSLTDGATDAAVVAQQRVAERDISAVLTLAPCIFEHELGYITPEDRSYVAAEMTAVLTFWLARLRCPVLNRPTAARLSGPAWSPEKWVRVAYEAGVPVESICRTAVPDDSKVEQKMSSTVTLTVVGNRVLGSDDSRLQQRARRLARAAAVALLAVTFATERSEPHFVSADVFPNLSDETVADAVLEYLRGQQAA